MCGGCWALWLGSGVIVGAGAATATVAYVKGNLEANVNQHPVEVAKATGKAFKALEIKEISSKSTALDAEIIGRTAKDDKVRVMADLTEANGSNLSIRIGIFGDEVMSRRIYEEIRKQFPADTIKK